MKCPRCGSEEDKVLDSRAVREGAAIRRRRECTSCGCRYTTYEEIVRDELKVRKRDGTLQPFDRQKLEHAIRRACGKHEISVEKIGNMIDSVLGKVEGEVVPSNQLAELVMKELHKVDEVAYIRFASVYRSFTDVKQFLSTITEIQS